MRELCLLFFSRMETNNLIDSIWRHTPPQGNYMNIVAKAKNMAITGIGMNCYLPADKPATVEVYTMAGRYNGNDGNAWYSKNRWTLVHRQNVICNQLGLTQLNFEKVSSILSKHGFIHLLRVGILTHNGPPPYPPPHTSSAHSDFQISSASFKLLYDLQQHNPCTFC